MKVGAAPSIRMPPAGSGFLERTLGVSTNLQDTSISLQGALAIDNEFCADSLPLHTSFDGRVTAKIDTSLAASQQEIGQKRKFPVNMLVYPSENLGVAKRSKCEASSSGSTILLPPHAERHSNYFQFGGASSSTSPRMDDRKQGHTHNSKVIWSSIPSCQLPNDNLVASLDNKSLNHNVGPSLTDRTIASVPSVPEMKFDTLTSEDKLKQRNIYDLAKLQGGFNSSSCNFDGLLNSIIKVENDDIPFMDNDLGCDLFPLGACI